MNSECTFSSGSKNQDFIDFIDSFLAEKSQLINGTVISTIKAYRTDRTEAIFINAPKYLKQGGHNICGQTFLITMMKYLKSNTALFPLFNML